MVLQTPQYVAFLYFYSYYRLIPTDGRKHEEDPDPSFFGDEVGHWDGDAFVIDSVGFKDTQVWADENGSPHSDALHVMERWTRPDAKHIHVDTTIEDPKFYTKPFTYSRTWEAGEPASAWRNIRARKTAWIANTWDSVPGPIRPMETRGYVNAVPLPPPPPPPAPESSIWARKINGPRQGQPRRRPSGCKVVNQAERILDVAARKIRLILDYGATAVYQPNPGFFDVWDGHLQHRAERRTALNKQVDVLAMQVDQVGRLAGDLARTRAAGRRTLPQPSDLAPESEYPYQMCLPRRVPGPLLKARC
jgi:hypothetical protein